MPCGQGLRMLHVCAQPHMTRNAAQQRAEQCPADKSMEGKGMGEGRGKSWECCLARMKNGTPGLGHRVGWSHGQLIQGAKGNSEGEQLPTPAHTPPGEAWENTSLPDSCNNSIL